MPDRGQVLTTFEKRIWASPTNRDILQYPEWIDVRGEYLRMALEVIGVKRSLRDELVNQSKLLDRIDELLRQIDESKAGSPKAGNQSNVAPGVGVSSSEPIESGTGGTSYMCPPLDSE